MHEFRDEYSQKPKVSQIMIEHMTILRRIYSNWSQIDKSKRIFSIENACLMFEKIR